MADHHDLAALVAHARHLDVDLRDERTRRIEHAKPARIGFTPHRLRNAVRAEDDGRAGGHFREIVDEHGAALAQVVDDEPVVHHFVTHVDRRAVQHDRALDDLDGAVDAGAEAARIGEQDLHRESPECSADAARCARWSRKLSSTSSTAPSVMAESARLNAGQ